MNKRLSMKMWNDYQCKIIKWIRDGREDLIMEWKCEMILKGYDAVHIQSLIKVVETKNILNAEIIC